ncbi:phosphate propanoyltransferase [Acetanaerobacterium elongatum]|uniref:Phosphate propanoyltransferase n=1 Tax=Acetanaerobacterium elongatum TaxID=258515 RepID=A0A1H0B2X8_9FIRM|nr:phosphate propanoyltransferase [Acetanaerobacterium elongatum]SDN39673.1 Propanediol utilization protein [Acetanaerobacterium elongatum]
MVIRMNCDKATVEQVTKLVLESLQQYSSIKTEVPVGVSARHIHLNKNDLVRLFGEGYVLHQLKPLSQPGQYAAEETVDITGPKGKIPKVRILGPERSATQVEITATDMRKLGINAPVRTSGDLKGTPGITITGPKGEITIDEGVIISDRHIHMTPADAVAYGVADGQKVKLLAEGEKGGILHNVIIRVSDKYALDCHIDTDDASAFLIRQGQVLHIIK